MSDAGVPYPTYTQAQIDAREQALFGGEPRMLPLDRDAIAEQAVAFTTNLRRAALGDATPVPIEFVPEIVLTLLRYPELWQLVSDTSIHLLSKGALTARDRELVVLRTTWLWQGPYAWGEHVRQGKAAGISEAEIEQVVQGSAAPGWSDHDRALMRAVEELRVDAMIGDETWAVLAQTLDERQLFELPVLVGQFTTVAYFQNALRLRLGAGNIGLNAR